MGPDPKEEHHEEQERPQECREKKMVLWEEQQQCAEEEREGTREVVGRLCIEEAYMKREKEVDGVDASVLQGALAVGAEDEDEMAAEIQADLIFSDEAFPFLPDFPCLSSPSNAACPSSSSSSSSSSAVSACCPALEQQHAVVPLQVPSPSEGELSISIFSPPPDGNQPLPALDSDCSMDLLAEMDLLAPADDSSWDPSSLFPDDDENGNNTMDGCECIPHRDEHQQGQHQQQQELQFLTLEEGLGAAAGEGAGCTSEELAMVFLEWLRSNKETISPQDLRSIRLRRTTIECAARNLGGGKEGMKKLLKLILAWVQNHHLQKKRRSTPLAGGVLGAGGEDANMTSTYQHQQAPIPPPVPSLNLTTGCPASTGAKPSPCHSFVPVTDTGLGFPACSSWAPPEDPMSCSSEALYSPGARTSPMQPFSPSSTFHAVEPICSWPPLLPPQYPSFPETPGQLPSSYAPGGHPGHYGAMGQLFHQGPGEPLVRLAASATKEARKKRMAKQRRFSCLHQHHYQRNPQRQLSTHQDQQQLQLQQCASGLPGEALCSQMDGHGNWTVWPCTSASSQQVAMPGAANTTAMQQQQRLHNFPAGCVPSDRRQGWKSEKNLRFLLQKVLKQSDVGSLGRIVLPKKEAEIHLPELDARDGICIAMEDIGTSRTWNMRYRFWPNNKSRMYLLENTGDFVRSNGLQEGDFIVIYSDVKCGKYMIRGVKVRQPTDSKVDGWNSGKQTLQKHGHNGTCHTENNIKANSSSSSSSSNHEKKENTKQKKEGKGLSGEEKESNYMRR